MMGEIKKIHCINCEEEIFDNGLRVWIVRVVQDRALKIFFDRDYYESAHGEGTYGQSKSLYLPKDHPIGSEVTVENSPVEFVVVPAQRQIVCEGCGKIIPVIAHLWKDQLEQYNWVFFDEGGLCFCDKCKET